MGYADFAAREAALQWLLHETTPFFLTYATLQRYAVIRRQLRPPYGPDLIGDVTL